MCDDVEIIRDLQRTIREKLDDRRITLKHIAAKSGIPLPTLSSYFPGNEHGKVPRTPAQLPASAIKRLCGVLPDDLLNLLFPDGFAIVRIPEGVDYDEVSAICRDFIDTKEKAHHPESEAGRDIGPNENATLGAKVTVLRSAGQ